jgi:RimJ/RimL family protein N-acetyltransferase
MWQNTRCERITGGCPAFNTRALAWCKALGFKEFGINQASFQKSGQLHDLVMLGISRPAQSTKEK